jgi:outer membrane protein assembly factor BamB
MIADGKFFILSDDAVLTMLRATTNGYQELARASIMKGRDAWGPFAIADGRMLLRDDRRLVCLDLRRSSTEAQP